MLQLILALLLYTEFEGEKTAMVLEQKFQHIQRSGILIFLQNL